MLASSPGMTRATSTLRITTSPCRSLASACRISLALEIDATFGLHASLDYHVGFGIDSHGVYPDAGTPTDPTLGLSFGVDAGLQGQVEVFGFPLASVGGDVGFAIEPYVTLTAPPWAADPAKVYVSDLALFGSNPVSDLLDDPGAGIQGDLTGNVYALIDLFLFSISWNWGVSIPVFNYERVPTWPAEAGGGGQTAQWPNVHQNGGVLTFTGTGGNNNIGLSSTAARSPSTGPAAVTPRATPRRHSTGSPN